MEEEDVLMILTGIEKLVEMDGPITKEIIEEVFGDNPWVYQELWNIDSDPTFDQKLTEFNARKKFLLDNGIEAFLIRYYGEYGYERFVGQYGVELWELFGQTGTLTGFSYSFSYEEKNYKY